MYATKIPYIVIFFISLLLHKPRDSFLNPYFFHRVSHTVLNAYLQKIYKLPTKCAVNFQKNSTHNLIFNDGDKKFYSIYKFFCIRSGGGCHIL